MPRGKSSQRAQNAIFLPSTKVSHVNLMTDTVIANLPTEALRSILRQLLGQEASLRVAFDRLAFRYLANAEFSSNLSTFVVGNGVIIPQDPTYSKHQSRARCLTGIGAGFDAMRILSGMLIQFNGLFNETIVPLSPDMALMLSSLDGDIVQAITAIQKELLTGSGLREMYDHELSMVTTMRNSLISCQETARRSQRDFAFARALLCIKKLNKDSIGSSKQRRAMSYSQGPITYISETIKLGQVKVPRMFIGLWPCSSPAWGLTTKARIEADFKRHVDAGFTAYDMADHYGDAEIIFGNFRSSQPDAARIYCATKWAVFEPIHITPEVVAANIADRTANIESNQIELLQLHWQNYHDHQYIEAARLLGQDPRIKSLGLCNFDTDRMKEVIDTGVNIVSNQVQFSLIDLRPTFKMAELCRKRQVKLLTYGSLCGGFVAEKWLEKSPPSMFEAGMTPSHRKYLEMIEAWGGWELFQDLLIVLAGIGLRHSVSLSNVAVRWVLQHEYVGAVIVGTRMGISENIEDNLRVFSFRLEDEDMDAIQIVLDGSRARDMFESMGDCGSEYR